MPKGAAVGGDRASRAAWDHAYRAQGRLWGGVRLDEPTDRLLTQRPELTEASWLEVACGDGKGAVPLATRLVPPGRLICIDASRWALVRARQRARNGEDDGSLDPDNAAIESVARPGLLMGDMRCVPIRSERVGVVRAVHALGHLMSTERHVAASGLLDVLEPGGWLLATEFGLGEFRAGKGECLEAGTWRRGTGVVTHYFDDGELARLIGGAGAEVVDVHAERFQVTYGGVSYPRERWTVVARCPH